MLKVNNKDTRTTLDAIANFEHVIASWFVLANYMTKVDIEHTRRMC